MILLTFHPHLSLVVARDDAPQVNYFNDLHVFDLDKQVHSCFYNRIPQLFWLKVILRSGAKSATTPAVTTGAGEMQPLHNVYWML